MQLLKKNNLKERKANYSSAAAEAEVDNNYFTLTQIYYSDLKWPFILSWCNF